jgi:hypothetical protein
LAPPPAHFPDLPRVHQRNVARVHRLWPVGESGQVPAISEPSV